MSMPILFEVYDETRRLAIAGSAVAPGDFRLKKLVPPLQKSGEKAPVFGKVALAITAVVDSNDKTASTALLELTTLVNAILYTQGETGIAGELIPLETTDLGQQVTQAGARLLKPLLEALNSTGSGRLELVKDAFERGAFKDLRLVKPSLVALDDPYPEIGEFIADKVLPLYGKAIVPELRAKLDIKGRGGHVRRLEALHQLDPVVARDFVQSALADGSKEMKVAAIECLGTTVDDIAYLLEHAQAKAKDVRAAALRALALSGTDTAEVIAALKKAIDSDDVEMIIARVKKCPLAEIQGYVLQQAEKQVHDLLKQKDNKLQGEAISRLRQLLLCLEDRSDAKAEAFIQKCFDQSGQFSEIKSEPSGADLNELVAHIISQGSSTMQKQLVAKQASLNGPMLVSALLAARAMLTPGDFYAEFNSVLSPSIEKRTKKNSVELERRESLVRVLLSETEHPFHSRWGTVRYARRNRATVLPELDARWLDAAVKARSAQLVCRLARPGHEAANQLLSELLTELKKDTHDLTVVMRTMVRVGHPQAVDAIIEALKKQAKETRYYSLSYFFGPMIADLPKSAAGRIEALLTTLPEKMVDSLMDSVMALKNKPE